MQITCISASTEELLPLRTRYRDEMQCQIVHDSIHARAGWTLEYLLRCGDVTVGFGSMAIAGPWTEKPTLLEFYVLPEHRTQAFPLFEALLDVCGARFMEIQSNDTLPAVMLHTYGRNVASEAIVFRDEQTTALTVPGATLRLLTSADDTNKHIAARRGGPEWRLELDGEVVGSGGILFHYNRPFGDVFMEIKEPYRRRGLGAYLVQELKREAYALGAIPGARCNTNNVASRRTLQKAGFVPYGNMLTGEIG